MRIVLTPKNTNPYLVPLNFVKIKNEKCWYKEGIQAAVKKSFVPCTRKGYVFFFAKRKDTYRLLCSNTQKKTTFKLLPLNYSCKEY